MVALDDARTAKIEDGYRLIFARNVVQGVVRKVECPAAGSIQAAQVYVLDGDIMDAEAIKNANAMIGDDAVAGIHVRAQARYAAGQGRVIAFNRQVMDRNVVGLHQYHVAAAGRQRTAGAADDPAEAGHDNSIALACAGQIERLVD